MKPRGLGEAKIFYLPYVEGLGRALALHNCIILPEKLKLFPRLHDAVLTHELSHLKNGLRIWEHIKLDFRDRLRLYIDLNLYTSYKQYTRETSPKIGFREAVKLLLFNAAYTFFSELIIPLILMPLQAAAEIRLWIRGSEIRFKPIPLTREGEIE